MYIRKIGATAGFAAGAAFAFAPLASADVPITSTVDSEISSMNSLFDFEARLAGDTADIVHHAARLTPSRWRTHRNRPLSRPLTTSCTG